MPKVEETKGHQINVSVSPTGFKRRMLFNRFALSKLDEHVIAYFGLMDESGILRDCFACALTKQTIHDNRASLTAMLAKVGAPTAEPPPKWAPPPHGVQIELANLINTGISTDAELLFYACAIGPAIAKSKETNKPIEMDPIAMLRCDPELLKLLIAELYNNV